MTKKAATRDKKEEREADLEKKNCHKWNNKSSEEDISSKERCYKFEKSKGYMSGYESWNTLKK